MPCPPGAAINNKKRITNIQQGISNNEGKGIYPQLNIGYSLLIIRLLLIIMSYMPRMSWGQGAGVIMNEVAMKKVACERIEVRERLPVVAWWSVPNEETTPSRYRELAEAGFTHSLSYLPDEKAAVHALDVAQGEGIKLLVYFDAGFKEFLENPAVVAGRLKNHPALAGYRIWDEPAIGQYAALATCVKLLHSADPDHIAYINLLPNYANAEQLGCASYREHVDRFIAEVPVKLISFDHYPFSNPTVGTIFYENIELVAETARRVGKPFWAFAESHEALGRNPRVPTLADMRLQVFANLAYGAQGIQYFTYRTPDGPDESGYLSAPIGRDGRRTPIYDAVKQINGELAALSGVFVDSEVVSVGHTGGVIPSGTKQYVPVSPVTDLETEGQGAVVSLLGQKARRFLIIVNRDYERAMGLTLRLDATVLVSRVDKIGVLRPIDQGECKTVVEPGDAVILTWIANVSPSC